MNRLVSVLAQYVDWLSSSYRASGRFLGVIRIWFAAFVLVFPVSYTWTSALPAAFLQPRPGITWVFGDQIPLWLTIALEVIRFCLALALLVGYRTFAVSIGLTLTLVSGSAIIYSFGKLDHFILFELFPLFMAFAGWGSRLSLDSLLKRTTRAPSGFPVLLWAMTVAFALFTASIPKFLSHWLDPNRLVTRGQIARDLSKDLKVGPLAEWIFQFDWSPFWKLLDWATLFAESWLLIAFLYPPLFRIGILVIMGFHIAVYLTLGIDFSSYFVVYAVFFAKPASWVIDFVFDRTRRHRDPAVLART